MMGLPAAVVTTSVYMRVSHSGKSNLKIPEIFEIFWPAAETCREATTKYSDYIFPVRIVPILSYQPWKYEGYQPWKYEGIGMHNVDTLVCQIGRNIGELWKLQGKMSYSEGGHHTARPLKDL